MAGPEDVREELAALQRGRGLGRPDLASALGPRLTSAFEVRPGEDPRTLAARLAAGLRPIIDGLPWDLRVSFIAALGATDAHPFLKDRLQHAASTLDRDVRTVRRRLRAANEAVAASLVASSRPGDESLRWYVESAHVIHDLTTAEPSVIAHRTIRATADEVATITMRFGLSHLDEASELRVSATGDAELSSLERLSTRVWSVTLRLQQPLSIGAAARFGLTVTSPRPDVLSPYNVMIPVRLCRSFRATARFAPPSLPLTAWRIDGELPAIVYDGVPLGEPYELDGATEIDATFTQLRPGLASGIGWRPR